MIDSLLGQRNKEMWPKDLNLGLKAEGKRNIDTYPTVTATVIHRAKLRTDISKIVAVSAAEALSKKKKSDIM